MLPLFDGIGLQAHHPDDWAFPLATVRSTLDLFARLGKQIHISELAFASSGRRVLGSPWRGSWSEEVQAEYAEDFYRVAMAHPAVASITWWVVASNEWRPKGAAFAFRPHAATHVRSARSPHQQRMENEASRCHGRPGSTLFPAASSVDMRSSLGIVLRSTSPSLISSCPARSRLR